MRIARSKSIEQLYNKGNHAPPARVVLAHRLKRDRKPGAGRFAEEKGKERFRNGG
jgi:hypothetical protein